MGFNARYCGGASNPSTVVSEETHESDENDRSFEKELTLTQLEQVKLEQVKQLDKLTKNDEGDRSSEEFRVTEITEPAIPQLENDVSTENNKTDRSSEIDLTEVSKHIETAIEDSHGQNEATGLSFNFGCNERNNSGMSTDGPQAGMPNRECRCSAIFQQLLRS